MKNETKEAVIECMDGLNTALKRIIQGVKNGTIVLEVKDDKVVNIKKTECSLESLSCGIDGSYI